MGVAWWSPPKQRQRWGEARILPCSNWGQIFFDLFYVGGAYNLGNLIKTSDLNLRCLLYFYAAGLPSMVMWYDKLYFDARFTTRPGNDSFHRFVEILQLCCVATALSRIRSVDVLSRPCEHMDMFQFSASLSLNSLIAIGRYVEVATCVIGDSAARVVARKDIACRLIPTMFLLAAATASGISFFAARNDDGGDDECSADDLPIWLCLASWLSWAVVGYYDQVVFAPESQRIESSVPLNVHFCVHRYGEWFMLMFGESVMSLLIVEGDNESSDHSVKFYCGVLSVICLAHLHFQSEPHHGEDHAITRSRHSNYLYTTLVPVYSMALIATGICYKMFLYDYREGGGAGGDYRRELGDRGENYEGDDAEKKQQLTANLFGSSIATVLILMDLMMLLHQGTESLLGQARRIPRERLRFLLFSKISLVLVMVMASYLQNDPHFMALSGLTAILFQEFLRKSFRAWQRQVATASEEDKSKDTSVNASTDSDTTVCSTDNDYQFDIEDFADAKLTLAKFEQEMFEKQAIVKIRHPSSRDGGEDCTDRTLTHSYYAI